MTSPRPARFIPELLDTHREDLAFLAGQRREALHSRRHALRDWSDLGERMEAHLQGLLVAPVAHLHPWLTPDLQASDRDVAFAAAWTLMRCGDVAASGGVVGAFRAAEGAALAGLRDAFSAVEAAVAVPLVRPVLEDTSVDPARAVAAAVVLANHGALPSDTPRLRRLLDGDDPAVLALAWQVVARADASADASPPARPFMAGVTHDSEAVRHAAWSAAAWTGQSPALPLLRDRARAGDRVARHWLCVLGDPEEATAVSAWAEEGADRVDQCAWLARHGHPGHLERLLERMADADVAVAVAAREAFTRITGLDVRGARARLPVAPDADDLTREMAPDVWLPDLAQARAQHARGRGHWAGAGRWCEGRAQDGPVQAADLPRWDLEARWDMVHRAAWRGRRVSRAPSIH